MCILVEVLGTDPSELDEDAELDEDLGADSLDKLEIAMALEDEFDIHVPEEVAEAMVTVRDVSKVVGARLRLPA